MKKSMLILGNVLMLSLFSAVEIGPDAIYFYPQAQARVGRPLTPMSVAGVARRTARRCAAGVYYCQKDKKVPTNSSVTKVVSKG